jgi:hypothetical protein
VFSNNDLREVSETTVNGVEVVVAKRDIVSTLPGNRCCAIVEDDEDYKFSACATFVQNPVEAGLIEPKAVVAAKDHKETKTAYTRLLANGGLASKLGISDTVVFVGSEHTASCVRQVVLNFSVPLRRIVIVYTNAQDDLYQGAKSEIAEIPGGGGDVSSSPSPPEVATSDADALAQQAAVQAQPPGTLNIDKVLDTVPIGDDEVVALLDPANLDEVFGAGDEGWETSDDDLDIDDDGADSPEACSRASHLRDVATLKDTADRGRGWFAKKPLKVDEEASEENVLAPYRGVGGTIRDTPFKPHYTSSAEFDAFLEKLTPAAKKKFEAYSMETTDGGVLSAYHPDAKQIPDGALINHDGFNYNVAFTPANNGCVDITLVDDVAVGEELLAD